MRIVQFRRNRLFHVLIGSSLTLLVLYILLNFSSDDHMNNIKEYWSQSREKREVKYLL